MANKEQSTPELSAKKAETNPKAKLQTKAAAPAKAKAKAQAEPKTPAKAPKKDKPSFYDQSRPLHRVMPYILVLTGAAFGICLLANLTGTAGGWLGEFLAYCIGGLLSLGVYVLPVILILHGIYWKKDLQKHRIWARVLFSSLFLLVIGALAQALTMPLDSLAFSPADFWQNGQSMQGGGLLGGMLAYVLYRMVGELCFFAILFSLLVLYVFTFVDYKKIKAQRTAQKVAVPKKQSVSFMARMRLLRQAKAQEDGYYGEEEESFESMRRLIQKEQRRAQPVALAAGAESTRIVDLPGAKEEDGTSVAPQKGGKLRFFFNDDTGTSTPIKEKKADKKAKAEEKKTALPPIKTPEAPKNQKKGTPSPQPEEVKTGTKMTTKASPKTKYQQPPLDLLADGESQVLDEETKAEIERNSATLIDTLESFRVGTHIVGISRGPRITRYEILPNDGVSISSISSHAKDISLRLASGNIRIQAPIPNMAAVGVEVPNRVPAIVRLKDLLISDTFKNAKSKTTVCLGSDVTGKPVFGDIAKMCHVLIAGATGMGKSVCMNAILVSLLYKANPDEVKLILIDPKKVELNVYNNIPHLLVPVVYEAQAAAGALIWAVGEMERRFELIEAVGARDIAGYNQAVMADPEKGVPLPKIIIVIDELNDLMMQARDSVEASICRIAQKARAAGMHLIIGTQRPSVNVITGVIKANIPSRIAFHVASNVDSRTILDLSGAEKLLANGDMLVNMPGFPEPERVQGAFVHEKEVDAVCKFLQANTGGESVYDQTVMEGIRHETEKYQQSTMKRGSGGMDDGEDVDDDIWSDSKFCQIVELAIREGKISTSLIQRELSLGYGRAARYIDIMCKMGIVSEPNGPKPRDTLIDYAGYEEMRARS